MIVCRSRSVGNDNHFSLCLSPCKQNFNNMSSIRYSNNHSNGNGDGTSGGGLLNPFKATKKFFKKLVEYSLKISKH